MTLKKKSKTIEELVKNKTIEEKQAELKAELDKKTLEDSQAYYQEYQALNAKWGRRMGSQYIHTQGQAPEFREVVMINPKK
jgi:hypothetical protein